MNGQNLRESQTSRQDRRDGWRISELPGGLTSSGRHAAAIVTSRLTYLAGPWLGEAEAGLGCRRCAGDSHDRSALLPPGMRV